MKWNVIKIKNLNVKIDVRGSDAILIADETTKKIIDLANSLIEKKEYEYSCPKCGAGTYLYEYYKDGLLRYKCVNHVQACSCKNRNCEHFCNWTGKFEELKKTIKKRENNDG